MGMLNFVIYVFELISVILIIHVVFQSRFRIGTAMSITLLFSVSMMFLAYITNIQYITYIAHIVVFFYCIYEFHRSWWETLLRFACSVAIGAILETIILTEVKAWLQTSICSLIVYTWISLGMLVCSIMLYWLFVYKQLSFVVDMSDKTFIFLVILINVFVLYVKEDGHGRYLRLIICVVSFLLLVARFVMITKKGNKRILEEETEWLSQYTVQYEELIQEVRRRQHDYKNEIQTIKAVCAVGEGATIAMETIKEYEDAEQYTGVLNGCENPVIAGLIYSKMREFKEQGVMLLCQIRMRNVGLAIEIKDIIDIIGILLDNAFECTKEQRSKIMRLEIEEIEKGVSIRTINPAPYVSTAEISRMFTLGYSTKGKNRGIGLHTVRELVKKSHGQIVTGNHTEDDLNFFDMQIMIPFHNKHVSKISPLSDILALQEK